MYGNEYALASKNILIRKELKKLFGKVLAMRNFAHP